MSFLTSNKDKALYSRALVKPVSDRYPSYRYKVAICYWGSIPEICHTLHIAKAPFYRWVNTGGGNVAKP